MKCSFCNNPHKKSAAEINRANKKGLKLFCSRECFGKSRRLNRSEEEKKALKAEYDRKYREENSVIIKAKKMIYNESPAGRATQKRARSKRKQYHNEYCRKPEQRTKERFRRYRREGKDKLKQCLTCLEEKPLIEFASGKIFHDGRYYLCKECDSKSNEETGLKTKRVINTICSISKYKLSRKEIAENPYMIEAKKYLLSIKNLTK